ncbi:hypothetical protein [Haloferula sargassicola]|uniref:Uncharacterized protein n=1 Tax=Haloferula sargassicola TaxID=490096 RepID=A0ABP9UU58_9BACT
MDFNQTSTDLIQLAKVASPWGAGCAVLMGVLYLIQTLRQPRALADAVKSMETQEERDALIEMFRIANPPKPKAKKKSPVARPRA